MYVSMATRKLAQFKLPTQPVMLRGTCFFFFPTSVAAGGSESADELKGLKRYAQVLLGYNDNELSEAIKHGALIEVDNDG